MATCGRIAVSVAAHETTIMEDSVVSKTKRLIARDSLPIEVWLKGEAWRRARNKIAQYYPASGPFRRELYAKHMACFAAGHNHRERLFLAGNRCGKTEGVGAYEMA